MDSKQNETKKSKGSNENHAGQENMLQEHLERLGVFTSQRLAII